MKNDVQPSFFYSFSIGKRIHTYNVEAYVQNTNYTLALCCRILFKKRFRFIPFQVNYRTLKKNFFDDIHHIVLRSDVYKCYLQNHRSIKIMLKHVCMYHWLRFFFQPLFYVPILGSTYFIKKTLYIRMDIINVLTSTSRADEVNFFLCEPKHFCFKRIFEGFQYWNIPLFNHYLVWTVLLWQ